MRLDWLYFFKRCVQPAAKSRGKPLSNSKRASHLCNRMSNHQQINTNRIGMGLIGFMYSAISSRSLGGKASSRSSRLSTTDASGTGGVTSWAKSLRHFIMRCNTSVVSLSIRFRHLASRTRKPALSNGGQGRFVRRKSHSAFVAPDVRVKKSRSSISNRRSSIATAMMTATRSEGFSPNSSRIAQRIVIMSEVM